MKRAKCFRCHKRAGGRRRAIMHVPVKRDERGRIVGREDEGYKLVHKACLMVEEQAYIRSQREARGFKAL